MQGIIFCPYPHGEQVSRVEMILKHCHTIADRDAWYECPVCGACSPTASEGTFDENSMEAYKLACRLNVAPVVRCKNCKFRFTLRCPISTVGNDDGFCSYGEAIK